MSALAPGGAIRADSAFLAHERVEGSQRVSGDPTTASLSLGTAFGAEFGLWEMAAGTMLDVEADEVFLVISGTATLEILAPERSSLDLVPGSVVRLAQGMQTQWTVPGAPLRKLYIVGKPHDYPLRGYPTP